MSDEMNLLIKARAARIGELVEEGVALPIEPLRRAAAELQATLAEAQHLERTARARPAKRSR